jgi:hypothetical protein
MQHSVAGWHSSRRRKGTMKTFKNSQSLTAIEQEKEHAALTSTIIRLKIREKTTSRHGTCRSYSLFSFVLLLRLFFLSFTFQWRLFSIKEKPPFFLLVLPPSPFFLLFLLLSALSSLVFFSCLSFFSFLSSPL